MVGYIERGDTRAAAGSILVAAEALSNPEGDELNIIATILDYNPPADTLDDVEAVGRLGGGSGLSTKRAIFHGQIVGFKQTGGGDYAVSILIPWENRLEAYRLQEAGMSENLTVEVTW